MLKEIKHFWTYSIRRQLILGIALLHAVLMTVFVFDLVERQRGFLHKQTTEQALSLAETLAANSTSWVLSTDVIGLEEVINSQHKYPGLEYAMVLSRDGKILAHTDPSNVGSYFSDKVSKSLFEGKPVQRVLFSNQRIIDTAAPIFANDKNIGWARVALNQDSVTSGLQVITREGMIYTLIAIAIGTFFAWLMAKGMTQALQQVVDVADKVTQGSRKIRANLDRKDELGKLAEDFNIMLDAFEAHENKLFDIQNKLEQRVNERTSELAGKNEELDSALKDAKDANTAKSNFLANMSHEIRTPMNGILGMLNLLLETPVNKTQKDFVETAHTSAEHLLTLLNDILDFSKIEAGKLNLEHIDFSVRDVVEDIACLFAKNAAEKDIEMIIDIDNTLPNYVIGDPTRLRQVLSNLLSNAVKFTDDGEVVIKSELIKADDNTSQIYFEVRDTGIGINKDKLMTIFDSFSQADSSTTRRFGGTGLGLSISGQLARLMGGEIGVHSLPGRGTSFWFSARFDTSDVEVHYSGVSEVLQKQHVLIVDDNKTNRLILENQMKTWGIRQYASAADGHKALELMKQAELDNDYTIVLLDMMMPEMDGLELADEISKLREGNIPIMVMLTSMNNTFNKEMLRSHHINACMSKPIRQSTLYDTMINTVTRQAQSIETGKNINQPPEPEEAPGSSVNMLNSQFSLLLAEDNRINQRVAAGYLKNFGYHVDVADNGLQAVEMIKTKPYNLVFMDCQMPEMDGFEATAAIRQLPKDNSQVTIIALTANAMKGDRERCIEAGMNDYMSKPFNADELKAMLDKWLSNENSDGVGKVTVQKNNFPGEYN